MFEILQVDTQFLNEELSEWWSRNDYQIAMMNIEELNVINDCAERGVKLSSDFLSASKTEQHYQDVLASSCGTRPAETIQSAQTQANFRMTISA